MRRKLGWTAPWFTPLTLLSMALLHASCGDSDDGGRGQQPGQTPPSFTGTFVGPERGSQDGVPFNTTLVATLSQSGNGVTGSFANEVGGRGSLNGTADGNSVAYTITDSTTGCVYSGDATLAGSQLAGQVNGAGDGGCPSLDASFTLTRQAPGVTPSPTPTPTATSTPPPSADCFNQPDGTPCGNICGPISCETGCTEGLVCGGGACQHVFATCGPSPTPTP